VGTGVITQLSQDRDPETGALGVAQGYTDGSTGSVWFSSRSEGGAWTTDPVYSGLTIGGVSFKFDAQGGDPWLLFTDGTLVTDPSFSLDFTLHQGRLGAGGWTVSEVPYPDAPLIVDLGFKDDGTPQLTATAARDTTIPIPGNPVTISLSFDVVTAEYGGASWIFSKAFDSTLGISLIGFPPTGVKVTLALASDVSWAKADQLLYSRFDGSVDLDISTFTPTGGELASDSQFMIKSGATYGDSGYYDGAPGRSYSWRQTAAGAPVCGYVRSGNLSAEDLLAGNLDASGELAYWQP
jgi:hypothetical protein